MSITQDFSFHKLPYLLSLVITDGSVHHAERACIAKFNRVKDAEDPSRWLLDETIVYTPSTSNVLLSSCDNEFEPAEDPVSPGYVTKVKGKLRQWLVSTGDEGRWWSTDNDRTLSQHDQSVS